MLWIKYEDVNRIIVEAGDGLGGIDSTVDKNNGV